MRGSARARAAIGTRTRDARGGFPAARARDDGALARRAARARGLQVLILVADIADELYVEHEETTAATAMRTRLAKQNGWINSTLKHLNICVLSPARDFFFLSA